MWFVSDFSLCNSPSANPPPKQLQTHRGSSSLRHTGSPGEQRIRGDFRAPSTPIGANSGERVGSGRRYPVPPPTGTAACIVGVTGTSSAASRLEHAKEELLSLRLDLLAWHRSRSFASRE
ncbi:uncharacterized protein N7459_004029 [Penicillium hispanicum]|uniref:uncharacterized protein n=1 Tax=Penicillium hispanicum TaxID=1080232 RepID=UPI002540BABC|nr:uncharacterized protein N7459_004029 [Penicillium hispanicum]KAJ5584229.1 hypothetical protein N7459_004029 [Penicillium hispanicum]